MAQTAFKGSPVQLSGDLPPRGTDAPDFTLTRSDLSDVSLKDYAGKTVVLNIFPSIDTPTCAMSVRKFNAEIGNTENAVVLCISADLPFAHARFCGAEGLDHVVSASTFRSDKAMACLSSEDVMQACTASFTAEHSRGMDDDGPCDDGRAGG